MAATLSMQPNGASALHPFFDRSNGTSIQNERRPGVDNAIHQKQPADDSSLTEATDVSRKGSGKRKKPRQKAQDVGSSQKTLAQILNPAVPSEPQDPEPIEPASPANDSFSESDHSKRRKRRRTSRIESQEVGEDEGVTTDMQQSMERVDGENMDRCRSPQVVTPPSVSNSETQPIAANAGDVPAFKTPPKKMLKLSAGGKLASPSAKKNDQESTTSGTKRRGRPRKAKEQQSPKSLDVCVRYGNPDDPEKRTLVGLRLDRILAGEERLPKQQTTPKKSRSPRKAKTTHPFFTGKSKEHGGPKIESPPKMTATTPGKLRSQALHDRVMAPFEDVPSNFVSALLKDRLMTRHPGAREASWPDRENVHVRDLINEMLPDRKSDEGRRRKQKQTQQDLCTSESIIHNVAATLEPESEPEVRCDGYHRPRPALQLPEKRLLSGIEIAVEVKSQLRASLTDLTTAKIPPSASQTAVHPALQSLWQSLPGHLSGFDHCAGEFHGWAQKFAPAAAQEVLQPTQTMSILTIWLKALMVNTVSSVSAPSLNSLPKEKASKPKKKRRQKDNDMDDFLVPSDEEVMDIQDASVADDELLEGDPIIPQSIVRVASGDAKLSNAVLLSGPHGCGKTAAAYAVAKELGYQVFEISSAERRSGRDVLDKVGDMTENHIVKHHGVDPGELSASEDRSHIEAAFQKDLDSGRQGKMVSFFKAKPALKNEAAKAKPIKAPTLEKLQRAFKKPAKGQQQSLILLEEVDVLFKEDKEFWNTVLKLVAISKRPVIMTCNDEDMVPLQAMSLHAVLRLGPPPIDLAADYLLLMAATEGHLLQRETVTSLYESRGRDLRGSITELDFWCQMGVGDPKGGLDWIFQRYPPGSDVDDQGRTLRVVSDGSFRTGMGFTDPALASDEEILSSVWHQHGLEPNKVLAKTLAFDSHSDSPSGSHPEPSSLDEMAELAESLSAMDVFTTNTTMDPSLPELPDKARSHYIEGMALFESNERADYTGTTARLAVSSTLLAYRVLGSTTGVKHALSTTNLLSRVHSLRQEGHESFTRRNLVCFDPITWSTSSSSASGLEYSALDGPMDILVTDIAPYIRSIVQYDLSLEEQRAQLGGFGEGRTKRARTTRAARSAMEGSQRASTRRERWFPKELNMQGVLATGGKTWPQTVARASDGEYSREASEAPASSVEDRIIYESCSGC